MTTFYWSRKSSSGGTVTMQLTIVGEVQDLVVTSHLMPQPIPVSAFQKCVPYQTLDVGPVPLQFLPLVATGLGCGAQGSIVVPSATSPSPLDPGGPGPWCDILSAGGTYSYATQPTGGGQPGGGAPPPLGDTPREVCDAAQHSRLLDQARNNYYDWCAALRTDQANVAAYVGAAATAGGIAAALIGAAAATANPYSFLALAIAAAFVAMIALIFAVLAIFAGANIGLDESGLADAQTMWRNAIASVKRVCCPDWILIKTDDLVCP